MAKFEGKLQDFYILVGPKIRNDVATITKKKKNELNNICQICNQRRELDAAHKKGRSRKDIIRIVLENYKSDDGKYLIPNLHRVIEMIKEAHKPIENNFLFLCKVCHTKYDDVNHIVETPEERNDGKKAEYVHATNTHLSEVTSMDYEEEFIQLMSVSRNLKQCLKELFMKFPDTEIKSTDLRKTWEKNFPNTNSQKVTDYLWNLEKEGVLENTGRSIYRLSKNKNFAKAASLSKSSLIDGSTSLNATDQNVLSGENLCENESQSWKYKIGWTSNQNRKNIAEIVSKIEQNFECKGEPYKSWYFFTRNNNNRQFAGIICHKHRSDIAFRFDHNVSGINDQRIITDKRWFFQQNEEGRIAIVPENYDLILQCLHHAYDITGKMAYRN